MAQQKIMQFKVGGVDYDVMVNDRLADDHAALGMCDHRHSEIQLEANQGETRLLQTLFHELTHAIFFEAGYDEHDEDMVNRLGLVMHQFMTDNFTLKDEVVGAAAEAAEETGRPIFDEIISAHAHPVGFQTAGITPDRDSDSQNGDDDE